MGIRYNICKDEMHDKDFLRPSSPFFHGIAHYRHIYKNTHILYLKYFSSSQKLYQCEIRLQTKIQITQRNNESKLIKTVQSSHQRR